MARSPLLPLPPPLLLPPFFFEAADLEAAMVAPPGDFFPLPLSFLGAHAMPGRKKTSSSSEEEEEEEEPHRSPMVMVRAAPSLPLFAVVAGAAEAPKYRDELDRRRLTRTIWA